MPQAEIFSVGAVVGLEDSYGTLNAAGDGVQVTLVNHSISVSRNRNNVSEIDGSVVESAPFSGYRTVSGDLTLRIRPKQIGHFMKYFLGAPVTTGTGPYTHTYTPAVSTTVPTFQMEVEYSDITEFEVYTGLTVTGVSFSVGGDGQLEMTLSVLGRDKTNAQTTAFTGTVTDLTGETDVFDMTQCTITAGTSTFTSETFDYAINRDAEQFYGIGDGANASLIFKGKYAVSGSTEVLFQDDAMFDLARAETPETLNVAFSDGTNSLTFNNSAVYWDESNIQPAAGTVKVLANMPFIGATGFTAVLINSQASYA